MTKVHTGDNFHAPKGKSSLPQKSLGQKMNMLLVSVPFFVTTIVAPGCSKEPSKVVEKNVNPGTTTSLNKAVEGVKQELSAGGAMLSLMSLMPGNEKKEVKITKKGLNNFYQRYIQLRSKLGPNTEIYTKNMLYKAYIDILKGGYEINGFKELDELKERIVFLSNGELIVRLGKSMPENSEFTGTIRIVGEEIVEKKGDKQERKFLLSNEKGSVFSDTDKTHITVDLITAMDAFYSDFPEPYTQALELIASKNNEYLQEQDKVRGLKRVIGEKEFTIEEGGKEINSLQAKLKKVAEEAKADADKAKADAVIAQQGANDNLKDERERLEKRFNEERQKLNARITALGGDIGNQKDLVNTQEGVFKTTRQTLTGTADSLSQQVTKLTNEKTLLQKKIDANEPTIKAKEAEIAKLLAENTKLEEEKARLAARLVLKSTLK